jgi:hypothetical protein
MNSFSRRFFSVLAILGALLASASPLFAEPAQEIDLETIKQRLNEWRGSFVNLRVVWELRGLPTTTETPLSEWSLTPELVDAAQLSSRREWIWSDHGLLLFAQPQLDGQAGSVDVFNGPKGFVYRAVYSTPREQRNPVLADLTIDGLGGGKPTSSVGSLPIKGLYWAGGAEWLPELLVKWSWTFHGIEELGGARCVRISTVNPAPAVSDVEWRFVLWIDLDHDCLVRRFYWPSIAKRIVGQDFVVDEFQRIDPGIWFPKRGRQQLAGPDNQLWEVTEVALNQTLDLTRFELPTPQIGTRIAERGRRYTYGTKKATNLPPAAPQSISESNLPNSPARSGGPTVMPWLWWSGALLAFSVLCLAAGFYFSRKT